MKGLRFLIIFLLFFSCHNKEENAKTIKGSLIEICNSKKGDKLVDYIYNMDKDFDLSSLIYEEAEKEYHYFYENAEIYKKNS